MTARRARLAFSIGAMLVAALVSPSAALCAASAPEAGGPLALQTWVDSGQLIIVTAITVPESTKLPVTVRVPVPEGATVQWAGEVLGGDLSADPSRAYKMIKSPVGGQYAEFTLEQTRSAQVDADMATVTVNGAVTSSSFDWVQSVVSPSTSFSARVPANASDVKFTPPPIGAPDTNEAGERLYSGEDLTLKPGQTQPVSLSYSTGTGAAPAQAAGGGDTLVFVLVGALVVALIALIVVLARQRRGASTPEPQAPARRRTSASAEPAPDVPASDSAADDDWGFDDEG